MSLYQISHPAPKHWVLDENGGINIHVVAGSERAMVMDTGFHGDGLRELAEQLTGLPTVLYHTHAHGDHVLGDKDWTEVWLHPAEWEMYAADHDMSCIHLHPIEDGMEIDLGGRVLEAIHVPGHSPGSVAFLDRAERILFSGDTVMTQPVFLHAPNASKKDYLASLRRLKALSPAFDRIYPTHRKWPITPDAIDALTDCTERALADDRETLEKFEVDLVVAKPVFWGYTKDGYAIGVKEAEGGTIPGL